MATGGTLENPNESKGNHRAVHDLLSRDAICAEIAVYLSSNPRAADTARGVAEWWIKRALRPTEEALLKLLRHGVVRSHLVEGTTCVYAYTRSPQLRRRVARSLKALNHPP